jgi:dTDP-4-dehydrorhamnose 3,5-epimerase
MKLIDEPLPGAKVLQPSTAEDERGLFVKTFHEKQLTSHGISLQVQEEFFTISHRGVLRGMHFQIPPHAHRKLIYCVRGQVLDVLLDLRRDSITFGRSVGLSLSAKNRHIIYVPAGIAHGFLSMEDNSSLIYKTDAVHAPESDLGIHWDSFGFVWPIPPSIVSPRDARHPRLEDFSSPF